MFVYIASDHAGFKLKELIKVFLSKKYPDFKVKDFGAEILDEADDYPDFVFPACSSLQEKVLEKKPAIGIVIGASGTGEAIIANRFEGVRTVVCNSENLEIIKLSRNHNDANAISFGARFITSEIAENAIEIFLSEKFDGGRHLDRINKIDFLE